MTEENLTDRVRDLRRLGGSVPLDVVHAANLPDETGARIRDRWVPDVALCELEGCGACKGEECGEDGEECEEATDGCEHG